MSPLSSGAKNRSKIPLKIFSRKIITAENGLILSFISNNLQSKSQIAIPFLVLFIYSEKANPLKKPQEFPVYKRIGKAIGNMITEIFVACCLRHT